MALVREMPVAAVANVVAEHDTRLWRVVRHYVGRAHDRQDWGEVRAVAIDETATCKGHRYVTVVMEIDPQQTLPARLLFMKPERSAASVGEFVAAMSAHGARRQQVELPAIESINSIIQTARHRARGFRNFDDLKAICYWMVGRLDLQIPSAFIHLA
jgi:transposase